MTFAFSHSHHDEPPIKVPAIGLDLFVRLPPQASGGAAHAFVNVGEAPARQTVLILPGLDAKAFFTELGAVMKDGVPGKDALNLFGHRWGVEFLGPPLKPGLNA